MPIQRRSAANPGLIVEAVAQRVHRKSPEAVQVDLAPTQHPEGRSRPPHRRVLAQRTLALSNCELVRRIVLRTSSNRSLERDVRKIVLLEREGEDQKVEEVVVDGGGAE